MELSHRQIAGQIDHLGLTGSLDVAGVQAVESAVLAHCGSGSGSPLVLLDLAATRFMGSLGVRLVLLSIKAVSARGGRLLLFNPSAPVAGVLDVSGLAGHVFSGSEADAVAALTNR